MTRAHYTETIIYRYGVLSNAQVQLYQRGTYNPATDSGTPATGLWTAETAGSSIVNGIIITNEQGEAECWATTPQDFDRVVRDNGHATHYAGDTLARISFDPFMDERSAQVTIDPSSLPASGFDSTANIVFSGNDEFTKPILLDAQVAPAAPAAGKAELWPDTDGSLKLIDSNGTKHYIQVGPTRGDIRSYIYASDPVGDYLNAFNRALAVCNGVYVPRGVWGVSNEVVVGMNQTLYSDAPGWDNASAASAEGAIIKALTAAQRSVVRIGAGAGATVNGFVQGLVIDGNQLATSAMEVGNSDGSAADASKLFHSKVMNGVSTTLKWAGNQCRIHGIQIRANINVTNPGEAFYQTGSDMVCVDMNINGGNRIRIIGDEGMYVGGHWTGNSKATSTSNTQLGGSGTPIDRTHLVGIIFDTAGPSAQAHVLLFNATRCRLEGVLLSNQYTLATAVFPAFELQSDGPTCTTNKIQHFSVCTVGSNHAGYTYGWMTNGSASKFYGNVLGPGDFAAIVGPGGVGGGPATAVFEPSSVMPRIVRPLQQISGATVVEIGQMSDLTDAVTIAADWRANDAFHLLNWATGHTLGAPQSITPGVRYYLFLENTTGAALTLNFNAAYHLLSGTSVVVAGGKRRVLSFFANSDGTILYETSDPGDLT